MSFDFQQFETLLEAVLSPDADKRHHSEKYYMDMIKAQPDQVLQALVHMLRYSQQTRSRGLAVIMLRRALVADYGGGESKDPQRIWNFITPQTKDTVKTGLLSSIEAETQVYVRTKVNDTIADLAAVIVKLGEWPDLLEQVLKFTRSGTPEHRESALVIFGQLVSLLGKLMEPYYNDIRALIEQGLQDASSVKVRVSAMIAATGFIIMQTKGPNRRAFQAMFPHCFKLLSDCIAAGITESTTVLQLFIEWAERDPSFFEPQLGPMVDICIKLAADAHMKEDVRQTCLELLVTLTEKKPEMMKKLSGYVPAVLNVIIQMLLEVEDMDLPEWNETDEDEDLVDFSNVDIAEHAMDRICKALDGKMIVMNLKGPLFQLINTAADWKHRHVGLQLITLVGEGCKKALRPYLNDLIASLLPRFKDPHPRVRWSACNTAGQMATDFAPTFQDKYHDKILPNLLDLLSDTQNPKVQSHAAAALTTFCGKYGKDDDAEIAALVHPYMNDVLLKLYTLLSSTNRFAVEEAVTCVASLATVASESFVNYYDHFMPVLKMILNNVLRTTEHVVLRAKCVECISLIGVAVGPERFMADAQEFLGILTNNFQFFTADEQNREFLMQASSRLCKCLREAFVPYLDVFMPFLLQYAGLTNKDFLVYQTYDGGDVDSETGWDFYIVRDKKIGIHQAALDEKLGACTQLHLYIEYLHDLIFAKWMEPIAKTLIPLMTFAFNKSIRATAIASVPLMLNATKTYCQKNNTPSTVFNSLFEYCYTELISALKEETQYDIMAIAIEAVHECIDICPDNTLPLEYAKQALELLPQTLKEINDTIAERASRREIGDTDETDEAAFAEEEMQEADVTVEFVEVICSLMKHHKPQFMELFPPYLPLISSLISEPNRRDAEKQLGFCIVDDLIEHTGEAAHSLAPHAVPLMMSNLASEHFGVRQACGYGLGLWAQFAPSVFAPFANAALHALSQVITAEAREDEDLTNPTENCISAFGKILLHMGPALDQAQMPSAVNFFVNQLPLVSDTVEAPVAHSTLVSLIQQNNSFVWGQDFSNLDHILLILVDIVDTELSDEALNPRIRSILIGMNNQNQNLFQAAAARLENAEHRSKLSEILGGH